MILSRTDFGFFVTNYADAHDQYGRACIVVDVRKSIMVKYFYRLTGVANGYHNSILQVRKYDMANTKR